jgi:hypothetical protein
MNAQKVKDETGKPRYDIRGDGGYVVAPPSEVQQQDGVAMTGAYRWRDGKQLISVEALLVFKMEWRPETQSREYANRKVTDGVKYINIEFRNADRIFEGRAAGTPALHGGGDVIRPFR